jgi:hypothetical protein
LAKSVKLGHLSPLAEEMSGRTARGGTDGQDNARRYQILTPVMASLVTCQDTKPAGRQVTASSGAAA